MYDMCIVITRCKEYGLYNGHQKIMVVCQDYITVLMAY